jgi:hypothetical protein
MSRPQLHSCLLLILGLGTGSCEAPALEPFGCDAIAKRRRHRPRLPDSA